MAQSDKARDAYYKRKYGIGLDEYNRLLELQRGVCAVCEEKNSDRYLAVEHSHDWNTVALQTRREETAQWYSEAMYYGRHFYAFGKKRSEAIRSVRAQLKTASVRCLSCWPCNRAIRACRNSYKIAEGIARVLRNHQIN